MKIGCKKLKGVVRMKVRHAVHQDIPKIAEIHVKSWQTTYQGIINQDYLDGLNIKDRKESWRKDRLKARLSQKMRMAYLVLLLSENNVTNVILHMMESCMPSIYYNRNRNQVRVLL